MKTITETESGIRQAKPASAQRQAGQKAVAHKVKIKSIMVPTDFSPLSKKALRYAERLAGEFDAKVTLMHVIEPLPADMEAYPLMLSKDRLWQEAKSRLDAYAEENIDREYLQNTQIVVGKPYDQIVALARSSKSDIIIIGTHGNRGIKHVFLGSTAEKVVRYAPCPVLTVREREHDCL